MDALTEPVRPLRAPRTPQGRSRYVPALPTLWPSMLVPQRPRAMPFPLRAEGAHFYYFARNAIWTAVQLLGLAGREVLVPAYHHGVEVEALIDAGVTPSFFPIGSRLSLDPARVLELIGPKTAAVYVIHYLGFPQPLDELLEACKARGIPLLEDCALALLSRDGDLPLGSRGDVSIHCLYKTLPVPNGGALVINGRGAANVPVPRPPGWPSTASHLASSLLSNLRLRGGPLGRFAAATLRLLGRAAAHGVAGERVATGTQHFDRAALGLGMSAASRWILARQDFDRIVELRRRNFFFLLGRLRDLEPPLVHELPAGVCPLFFPLLVDRKDLVRRRLAERGIESIDFWRTGHPTVRPGAFPDVERLRARLLELPTHQDLSPETMEFIADSVRAVLRG